MEKEVLSLSVLHENVNNEEYGEEIYKDIYCKDKFQLVEDYRNNSGIMHI